MDISNVKIRNKIIRILAVVLLVFSFIITPVVNSPRLAYASSINVVGASDPYEDLKISKGFDESKLENVDDIVVLDMFEYWPSDDAQYPQLLLYVYNPTDSDLKKSTDNRIHIRIGGIDSDTLELNWVRHWNSYKLEYLTTSANDKYVKYMVSDEDTQTIFSLFSEYESGLRYYDISEVKLAKDNNRTPSSYTVGFKYLFEVENGELFCKKEEYNVIRVDNLIPMVYRDIKSGVYNYPSGQINSVAFTLPKDIVEKYGEVSEIHFEYWKYKTSPIVVSDTRDGVNLYQNNDSWVGKKQSELSSYYPSIRWGNKKDKGSQTVPKIVYDYTYNYIYDGELGVYDKISYSFSSGNTRAVNYDVSSAELVDWIYSYANTYLSDQEYESIPIKDGRLPAELFEDYYNTEEYGYKNVTVSSDTFAFTHQNSQGWLENFLNYNTSYTDYYDSIQKVSSGDFNSLPEAVYCDFYKINKTYYEQLGAFSLSAGRNGEIPYIFHFDLSDYYTAPCYLSNVGSSYSSDGTHAYVAQEDVYLNFTFLDFTFVKEDVVTVLAVSSPVIDIIPPVQHPVAGTSCINFDFLDWLRMIFGIIILLLLLIFFWNPIIFILKLVIKILIAPFKLIGSLFSKNKNNENASGDKKADKKIKKLDKKIKKLEKQSRKLRKKR